MKELIKEIITDPMKLKIPCRPIGKLQNNALLDEIVMYLTDTYKANQKRCLGLAANQIGYQKRVILVRITQGFVIMINPVIVPSLIHGRITKKENCLSFPGQVFRVKRYKRIKVIYHPYTKEPVPLQTHKYTGLAARIVQHEVDHLNGVLR